MTHSFSQHDHCYLRQCGCLSVSMLHLGRDMLLFFTIRQELIALVVLLQSQCFSFCCPCWLLRNGLVRNLAWRMAHYMSFTSPKLVCALVLLQGLVTNLALPCSTAVQQTWSSWHPCPLCLLSAASPHIPGGFWLYQPGRSETRQCVSQRCPGCHAAHLLPISQHPTCCWVVAGHFCELHSLSNSQVQSEAWCWHYSLWYVQGLVFGFAYNYRPNKTNTNQLAKPKSQRQGQNHKSDKFKGYSKAYKAKPISLS